MTEAQWLTCSYPDVLLDSLSGRASARQLRLFAVACCRRVWHLLPDALSRAGIETAERSAEGLADERELEAVRAALMPLTEMEMPGPGHSAHLAAFHAAHRVPYFAGQRAAYWTAKLETPAPRRQQTDLFRHIAGNPFRPSPALAGLPRVVVQLAEALYDRDDCAFALHDALLEADQATLAEHFAQETTHPRGCWALDLILGKT